MSAELWPAPLALGEAPASVKRATLARTRAAGTEASAGDGAANARLATARKRPSEEVNLCILCLCVVDPLSTTQGQQLIIKSDGGDLYTPRKDSWNS